MFEKHFIKEKLLSEFKQRWKDTFENDLSSIDKKLVETLYYLNKVKGLASVFSCEGHDNDNFYISLVVSNKNALEAIDRIHESVVDTLIKSKLSSELCNFSIEISYLVHVKGFVEVESLKDGQNYPVFTIRIFNNRSKFKKTKAIFYDCVKKVVSSTGSHYVTK